MLPIEISIALEAADADGIAQSQSRSTAGAVTLNGSLVTSGVAYLQSGSVARSVQFTFAQDATGKSYTVYGTVFEHGDVVFESVSGTSVSAQTTNYFLTVTEVLQDAGGGLTIGTNGVGSTKWLPVDWLRDPFSGGFGCVVTGTVNYTMQHTFDDIFDGSVIPVPFDHTDIAGETANQQGNYQFAPRALRVEINSGTGTVRLVAIQSWDAG